MTLRSASKAIAAAGLYFALAASTIHLTSYEGSIATVWPANAVVVAMMLQRPRGEWPLYLLAALLGNGAANMAVRGAGVGSLMLGLSNLPEILIAAWGLRRGVSADNKLLHDKGSVIRFIFWSGLLAPAASTGFGALTAYLMFGQPIGESVAIWFAADALGLLVFTPFFHCLFAGQYLQCFRSKSGAERLQTLALQAVVVVVAAAVFRQSDFPLLFVPILPLILVTFRLGWLGTNLAVMLIAAIGAVATMHGAGPVSLVSWQGFWVEAAFFQVYLAFLLLTNMPIAASLDERRALLDKLAQRERAIHVLAESSSVLLVNFSPAGRVTQVAGDAVSIFGRSAQDLIGEDILDLQEVCADALMSAHVEAIDNPQGRAIAEIELEDGRWIEATFCACYDSEGQFAGSIATILDATRRKLRERQLADAAHTDELTGVLNRAGFMERFEAAIADERTTGISLALIDVDRFKSINDDFGHPAGDAVLREIAARLVSEVRDTDLVGRLGGDEFVILLRTGSTEVAQGICRRIVDRVASEAVYLPFGQDISAQISCGLVYHIAGLGVEDMIHNADAALYAAKRSGRNQLQVAA
ncbi:sensor domain-containing diguanylate cyclase [Novosphingobium pentaromativorans]|uniref:Sensory box-containing diguanylate cyclase n=1 Tax=Novosphingobium pentaromativorans US6-1 TaxID=1088721 RepID=G6EC31_9SPHN|nr:sensor domain-containing diguanylate cyclase [Novosphingobium pentaromativorans]EHJ61130.1 sensory box-containing diguanylate cyclase [Novosphingobium pentaromativorans US6-1]